MTDCKVLGLQNCILIKKVQFILVNFAQDAKLLKSITKVTEEWIKARVVSNIILFLLKLRQLLKKE
jgi:hypothetical protein